MTDTFRFPLGFIFLAATIIRQPDGDLLCCFANFRVTARWLDEPYRIYLVDCLAPNGGEVVTEESNIANAHPPR